MPISVLVHKVPFRSPWPFFPQFPLLKNFRLPSLFSSSLPSLLHPYALQSTKSSPRRLSSRLGRNLRKKGQKRSDSMVTSGQAWAQQPAESGPFGDKINDNVIAVTAICLHVEDSPHSPAGDNKPCPLSGEPGPQIDYKLVQLLLKWSKAQLTQEDLVRFEAVDRSRLKYFAAYECLFNLVRGCQDLWAERRQLVSQEAAIKANPAKFSNTALAENARRQAINARECTEAVHRSRIYKRGITMCTDQLSESKRKVLPIVKKLQHALMVYSQAQTLAQTRKTLTEPPTTPDPPSQLTQVTGHKRRRGEENGDEDEINKKRARD
jgi:hypothetical protein